MWELSRKITSNETVVFEQYNNVFKRPILYTVCRKLIQKFRFRLNFLITRIHLASWESWKLFQFLENPQDSGRTVNLSLKFTILPFIQFLRFCRNWNCWFLLRLSILVIRDYSRGGFTFNYDASERIYTQERTLIRYLVRHASVRNTRRENSFNSRLEHTGYSYPSENIN